MYLNELLEQLARMGNAANREGMARFGIPTQKAWGITVPQLRGLAKDIGKNADLSDALWLSGFHEARLLSFFLLPPAACTPQLMENRLPQINSWDLCDQACCVFATHPSALQKAADWSLRTAEFEKRAAFSLMAFAAVHQKKTADEAFLPLLSILQQQATDPRGYVYKAVNWALRQIGKRSTMLNEASIQTAGRIREIPDKTARWIAADALRELTSFKVQARIAARAAKNGVR